MRMKKQKREFLHCLRLGDYRKGVLTTSKNFFFDVAKTSLTSASWTSTWITWLFRIKYINSSYL